MLRRGRGTKAIQADLGVGIEVGTRPGYGDEAD
jgi:hypothetical protein